MNLVAACIGTIALVVMLGGLGVLVYTAYTHEVEVQPR